MNLNRTSGTRTISKIQVPGCGSEGVAEQVEGACGRMRMQTEKWLQTKLPWKGMLCEVALACVLAFLMAFSSIPADSLSLVCSQAFADEVADGESADEEEPGGVSGESGGGVGGVGGGSQDGETGGDPSGGSQGGGADGSGDPSGGSGSDSGSGGDQSSQYYVDDVGIFYHQTDTCLGRASSPNMRTASITQKGGTLQFDSVVYWTDWSSEPGTRLVEWSASDNAIATINSAGILTAVSDGTVELRATVRSNTESGSALVATAQVEIAGQGDSLYVSAIRIAGPDGGVLDSSPYILEEDLATAQAQFYALVDVVDPASGQTHTYSTQDGALSSQTNGGVADLVWYVGDSAMASVEETLGLFRPITYGIVTLFVTSSAGLGNATVKASATVNTKDPEGGMVQEGYHPQSSISVKAYYELYPPTDMNDDDDEAFVISKTYSVEEMESMGMVTQCYTAIGSGSWYTMTGCGVPLSTLLQNAGVNMDGIAQLAFGTADVIDRPVSYNYIFGTNRYYYPNIDIGSYAEAQQVYPILALMSNEVRNASTEPNYDMSEGTRFRLLFGSTPDGGTSQYQIKWIHTLYVILAGGPAVEEGDGTGGSDGDNPGGGSSTGGGTEGEGPVTGEEGMGAGGGLAEGTQGGAESASLGETEAAEGASGASAGESLGSEASTGNTASGKFSVYQVMNKNDSDTETTIDPVNPFKPFAAPIGVSVLALGGLESFLWFRRQTRLVALAT